jgi:hypothetical protein
VVGGRRGPEQPRHNVSTKKNTTKILKYYLGEGDGQLFADFRFS